MEDVFPIVENCGRTLERRSCVYLWRVRTRHRKAFDRFAETLTFGVAFV
jgi:hypothetical protein